MIFAGESQILNGNVDPTIMGYIGTSIGTWDYRVI